MVERISKIETMSNININNIKQLLSQIQTIRSSYDRLNKANGSYFNIFSILKIETDEVKTHSRFIAELLNPGGKHGFKDEFLKAFIVKLGIDYQMNTKRCETKVEHHIGKINKEYTKGGNIDILIWEKNNRNKSLMIENKIYAVEQRNQLLRYQNGFPKGKVIYLTLFGDISNEESSKTISYEKVSYETDIINWLEECKRISVDNPTLRETIKQYINLIKKLTNQNINKEMNEELAKLFVRNVENYDSFMSIVNSTDYIKNQVLRDNILPILYQIKKDFEEKDKTAFVKIDEQNLLNSSNNYNALFTYQNQVLTEAGLKILFEFQQKNHNFLIGGFVKNNLEESYNFNIHSKMCETFNKIPVRNSESWLSFFEYYYFMNWSKNLLDLKNLIFGNFKDDLRYKLSKMIEISNSCFLNN